MKTPVVLIGASPWSGQWRRRQHLGSHLARLRPVFHLDPPWPATEILRRTRPWRERASVRVDPSGVRIVPGPIGLPGERFLPETQRLNGALYRRWLPGALARLEREHGVRRPILVCCHPLMHPLGPVRARAAQVVYDVIDDYAARTPFRRLRPLLRERTLALARSSDLVLATSAALEEALAMAGSRVERLPHGVDPALFHPDAWKATRFARWKEDARPQAVYHGTLDHKIDLVLLEDLLRAGVTLLLAGETAWPGWTFTRLQAIAARPGAGAVHWFGLLEPREAAALVACADVGILPYVSFAGEEGASILKHLEFLATGLPVVASDTEPCRRCESVRLAANRADFVAAVLAAARNSGPDAESERERRLRIAAAHSWSARAMRLDGWLVA